MEFVSDAGGGILELRKAPAEVELCPVTRGWPINLGISLSKLLIRGSMAHLSVCGQWKRENYTMGVLILSLSWQYRSDSRPCLVCS